MKYGSNRTGSREGDVWLSRRKLASHDKADHCVSVIARIGIFRWDVIKRRDTIGVAAGTGFPARIAGF
ncbi:hypothetical protein [Novipirellula maiorica]|uniref:hypothetical protein n=1 Tax=Novipirellula maiorica TaxID=1265734 RepID=UPI000593AE17|nr:hypothetical protein [Rhodopirellula maiorica]